MYVSNLYQVTVSTIKNILIDLSTCNLYQTYSYRYIGINILVNDISSNHINP